MAIQMTEARLQELRKSIKVTNTGSQQQGDFTHCIARFRGERNKFVVEIFLMTVNIYKKCQRMDYEGLPILSEGIAATLCKAPKQVQKTWTVATDLIEE